MSQNICDAIDEAIREWEAVEVLIRVEDRIWEASCEDNVRMGSSEERAYFDAFDIVRNIRRSFESTGIQEFNCETRIV